MAYSDFTLERLLADFNLPIDNGILFPDLVPIAIPQSLTERLAEGRSLALLSEKARSEVYRRASPACGSPTVREPYRYLLRAAS